MWLTILKILIALLAISGICILCGQVLYTLMPVKNSTLAQKFIAGLLFEMAVYEVLYIFMVFRYVSLGKLTFCWMLVTAVTAAAGLWISVKKNIQRPYAVKKKFKKYLSDINIYTIVMLILICAYTIMTLLYQQEFQDDAFFAGIASTSYTTDTIIRYSPYTGGEVTVLRYAKYVFSGYPVMIASLARVTLLRPIVVMHIVIPVLMIGAHYILCYMFAQMVFRSRHKSEIAMIILGIINMNSLYVINEMSTSAWMFVGAWYGKSILSNVCIISLWYYLIKTNDSSVSGYLGPKGWIIIFIADMAAVLSSTFACIAVLAVSFVITLFYFVKKRSWFNICGWAITIMPMMIIMLMTYLLRYKA